MYAIYEDQERIEDVTKEQFRTQHKAYITRVSEGANLCGLLIEVAHGKGKVGILTQSMFRDPGGQMTQIGSSYHVGRVQGCGVSGKLGGVITFFPVACFLLQHCV